MTTFQKDQNINIKPLKFNIVFLLASRVNDYFSSHHFSRVGNLMGRHKPIPTCQFNEASTHYLAPGMLGRWGQWGKPTISQSMWPPFQCHMCNNVTYPILRRMLGYTND